MWFQQVAGSPPGCNLQDFFFIATDNFPQYFFESAVFTSRVVDIAQLSIAGYKYHNLIFVSKLD